MLLQDQLWFEQFELQTHRPQLIQEEKIRVLEGQTVAGGFGSAAPPPLCRQSGRLREPSEKSVCEVVWPPSLVLLSCLSLAVALDYQNRPEPRLAEAGSPAQPDKNEVGVGAEKKT